jgi:pimeloyl-ACP methyl ester carboxylesterase
MNDTIKRTQTENLEIAYEEHGGPQATPVIMAHGFPTTCERDAVAPALAEADSERSRNRIGLSAFEQLDHTEESYETALWYDA